jgi:transposase
MSLFGFDQAPKIFIFAGPTDMRKGFDSLSGLVSNEMQMDPLSGYLFVFMNKNRNLIKILRWDSDGFSLFYKRLEKGSYQRPTARIKAPNSELSKQELFMILHGIDFDKTKKRKRYFHSK